MNKPITPIQLEPEQKIVKDEYNCFPYAKYCFHETHPDHLYTLGRLHGLNPTLPNKARVLELGCASGSNIIPMAYHNPHMEILGIDLSEVELQDGIKEIADLKLTNITLKHLSILDINQNDGKFDYIICHGVYSWVDDTIQDKIMRIFDENLAPNGIGYISYNTLPGWNLVKSVQELLAWSTKDTKDPFAKVKQAHSFLKYFSNALENEKTTYAEIIKHELSIIPPHEESYFYHEFLSTYNKPIYFQEFTDKLSNNNLVFLCEAYLSKMYIELLPNTFIDELKKIDGIEKLGQYIDFIVNRRFRSTLVCHKNQKINRHFKEQQIEQFYLQFDGLTDKIDVSTKDVGNIPEITFYNSFVRIKLNNPISQWIMLSLLESKNKPIHFLELCEKISANTSLKSIEQIRHHFEKTLRLIPMINSELINISSSPPTYTLKISEKPIACSYARYQSQIQSKVINRRHESIFLDPISSMILPYLNGTNDIEALMVIARNNIDLETLTLLDENKNQITDAKEVNTRLKQVCQTALNFLASNALIIDLSQQ